ncbi:MAG: thiamine-phosphate pyrophosphorylase [Alphaproteobacteria bacterium]|nr:thiamine-phosphate pyrophosphorylase [Alphaproteobacteria bacterium]
MAPREQRIEARRVAPRLYLLPPPVADPGGLGEALAAALGAADVAAVLLSLAAADDRTLINRVKALAPAIQDRGAALLLHGLPDIVARAGADGAHLIGIGAFEAARATLKPDRIAGCGGLVSRHDAMVVAEAGADYVMFGEPDEEQRRPSFDAVIERIEWWAEVFEAPCVGFAGGLDEVAPLAAAGADFVAVGEWIFADARGPALAIAEAAGRLADLETAG